MLFVYFVVALLATIIGSVAGLGGGVIIKPVLDLLAYDNVVTITFLSSVTVFSMSVVALYQRLRQKARFDLRRVLLLATGSITSGMMGNLLLHGVVEDWGELATRRIQSIALLILMIVIYAYTLLRGRIRHLDLNHPLAVLLLGVVLGFLASFLGIGGGPINVMVLMLFLDMDVKNAAVHSILIIYFAQLSNIAVTLIRVPMQEFPLPSLVWMASAGILGGYLGSKLALVMNERAVMILYQTVLLVLILLNAYNVIATFA